MLPQDRMQPSSRLYSAVSLDTVEGTLTHLLDSADRSDQAACRRIQDGMRTIIGPELQSQRYHYVM